MLGEDGKGFDIMMGAVLPMFNVLNAACSVGIMESGRAADRAACERRPLRASRIRRSPICRRSATTSRGCGSRPTWRGRCWTTRFSRLEAGRADAMLRVLSCKAAAGEAAIEVVETAMRVCGGAAFRKDVARGAILPRCARGRRDGADDRCAVRLHRQGRLRHAALLRRPMTHDRDASTPGRRRLRPEGRHHLGRLPAVLPQRAACRSTTSCTRTTSGRWKRTSRAHPRRLELAAGLAADRAHRRAVSAGGREAICMRDTDRDLTSRHPRAGRRRHRDRRRSQGQERRGGRARLAAGDADPAELPGGSRARRRSEDFEVRAFDVLRRQARRPHRRRARRGSRAAARRGRRRLHHRREPSGLRARRDASVRRRRECSRRRRPTITATSPCSTASRRSRSLASASCCWRCRTPMPRSARCSISKA